MGIEAFFNSLKNDYEIIKNIDPETKIKYDIDSLFFDFNSIVHNISQRLLVLLNKLLKSFIKKTETDIIRILKLDDFPIKPSMSNENIYLGFKQYFNDEKIEQLIIDNIKIFLQNVLDNYFGSLDLVYMCLDGVPSKAKMVEQKKRRYMAVFESESKKLILNKYKKYLQSKDEYNLIKNKISWQRSIKISPGTAFMIKLDKELAKLDFKNAKKTILAGFNDPGEAETKIMKYIDDNNVGSKICIYSPDADLILLMLILKNKDLKQNYILRYDAQKSEILPDVLSADYAMIDITKLEKIMIYQFNKKANKKRLINDIVFIFTFFGDDFLHKLEFINARRDIKFIIKVYNDFLKSDNYILDNNNNINKKNLLDFFKEMAGYEDYLLKRNYLTDKYFTVRREFKNDNPKKDDHSYFNYILKKKKLLKQQYTIHDRYHKRNIYNKNDYEIELYKLSRFLDEYNNKLNHIDQVKLGKFYDKHKNINNDIFNKTKINFYNYHFENNKDKAIDNYIEGLVWLVEHYYHHNLFNTWFYKYSRAPLLKDIIKRLETTNLDQVKDKLQKYKSKYKIQPIEQLLFIIPFKHNFDSYSFAFRKYKNKDLIKKFVNDVFKNELKDLYPDIQTITNKVLNSDNNDLIDCSGARFFNKCILKCVKQSNKIDLDEFIKKLRKFLS